MADELKYNRESLSNIIEILESYKDFSKTRQLMDEGIQQVRGATGAGQIPLGRLAELDQMIQDGEDIVQGLINDINSIDAMITGWSSKIDAIANSVGNIKIQFPGISGQSTGADKLSNGFLSAIGTILVDAPLGAALGAMSSGILGATGVVLTMGAKAAGEVASNVSAGKINLGDVSGFTGNSAVDGSSVGSTTSGGTSTYSPISGGGTGGYQVVGGGTPSNGSATTIQTGKDKDSDEDEDKKTSKDKSTKNKNKNKNKNETDKETTNNDDVEVLSEEKDEEQTSLETSDNDTSTLDTENNNSSNNVSDNNQSTNDNENENNNNNNTEVPGDTPSTNTPDTNPSEQEPSEPAPDVNDNPTPDTPPSDDYDNSYNGSDNYHTGGSYTGDDGYQSDVPGVTDDGNVGDNDGSEVIPPVDDSLGDGSASIDDVIKENYTKIPSSSEPITSKSSKGGSTIIPIIAGLSAAAAAGIGTKAYLDRKENNENGEDSGDLEAEEWSDDNNLELEYDDNQMQDEYLDEESDEADDYAYPLEEPVEKYDARSNDELEDLQ